MNPVNDLRTMAKTEDYKLLFTVLAERNNSSPVKVDKFETATRHKVARTGAVSIVSFLKALDSLNLGNFIPGRRDHPSRFVFYYTPQSIGNVALSQANDLVRIPTTQIHVTETPVSAPASQPKEEVTANVQPTVEPFTVTEMPVGTLFVLPKNASRSDAERMIDYIRSMPWKQAS